MGNTFSQRNAVIIETEKKTYYDGEVVEGVVCLNLVDPLDVSSIECQLQGLERTDFQGETFGTDRTDLGRLDQFLSACCTLPDTERRLEPGQYQWCFMLGLPAGSRSTFRVQEGTEDRKSFSCAKVEYRLNVYVGKRDKSGRQVPVLTFTHPLVVHRRAKEAAVTSIERSKDANVTRWCCISEGTIGVRAVVERCTYLPGDEVAVRVEVDNRSPRRIEAVQLALRHMNWLRMSTQLEDHERQHIEHFYKVPDGAAVESYSQQERLMRLELPEGLPCTYTGTCVTSKFFLAIKLRMGLSTGDVSLMVPVTVLPPQPRAQGLQPPERPDFWHPQQMGAPTTIQVPGWADGVRGKFEWVFDSNAAAAVKFLVDTVGGTAIDILTDLDLL